MEKEEVASEAGDIEPEVTRYWLRSPCSRLTWAVNRNAAVSFKSQTVTPRSHAQAQNPPRPHQDHELRHPSGSGPWNVWKDSGLRSSSSKQTEMRKTGKTLQTTRDPGRLSEREPASANEMQHQPAAQPTPSGEAASLDQSQSLQLCRLMRTSTACTATTRR